MAKFSELGVEPDVIVGKGIDIEDLFGRRILIEKTLIQPTNYPGKNLPEVNNHRQQEGLPPVQIYPLDTTIIKVGKCFQFT